MRIRLPIIAIICTLSAPAFADSYPVQGQWGESNSTAKGAIDCSGRRVIGFSGNQRTDSKGGVPAVRNRSVTTAGADYRVSDEFSTGQITNGRTDYTLRKVDDDHIELNFEQGGALKLQRCK